MVRRRTEIAQGLTLSIRAAVVITGRVRDMKGFYHLTLPKNDYFFDRTVIFLGWEAGVLVNFTVMTPFL